MELDSEINGKPWLPEALHLFEKLLKAIFCNVVSGIYLKLLECSIKKGAEEHMAHVSVTPMLGVEFVHAL